MDWAGRLRFGAAVLSSASFGLVAAPLLPIDGLVAAVLLAICFGFFFLLGTGYRILIAAFTGRHGHSAGASWTGACFASAGAAAVAASVVELTSGDGMLVMAAFATALNVAYGLVKLACARAGCCAAARASIRGDLRLQEVALTAVVLIATLAALGAGATAAAAAVGIAGHLAIRLFSRWARERLPARLLRRAGVGHEMLALVVVLAIIPALQVL